MIVYACFEGDVDMALAGVQHDLYFAYVQRPEIAIGGSSTLGWIWANVQRQAARRRPFIPWIDRNLERIRKIDRFSHKLLQVPHEHIAAYHRWTMPRIARRGVIYEDGGAYPMDLLDSWRAFLIAEIPDLLSSDEALVALAKSMVYQLFDSGDRAYFELQDILMRRYGFHCVERTYWAAEVRDRIAAGPNDSPKPSNEGTANA